MLKSLRRLGTAVVLCLSATAYGQALPTATGTGGIQVGGGYSVAKSDYGQKIQGISAFADWDLSRHLGGEVSTHFLSFVTPNDIAEDSFLAGPRFYTNRGKFMLYGKGLIGVGDLIVQEYQDNIGHPAGTFLAYGAGAGVDYRLTPHVVVRCVDMEYQHWSYQTGLTPIVFTFGVAYHIH